MSPVLFLVHKWGRHSDWQIRELQKGHLLTSSRVWRVQLHALVLVPTHREPKHSTDVKKQKQKQQTLALGQPHSKCKNYWYFTYHLKQGLFLPIRKAVIVYISGSALRLESSKIQLFLSHSYIRNVSVWLNAITESDMSTFKYRTVSEKHHHFNHWDSGNPRAGNCIIL